MGNGAGVPLDHQSHEAGPEFTSKFSKLEKRVKAGFFERVANEDEYLRMTTNAIEKQELDVLELLLKGGDMKPLLPLHIAAQYGSVEAMDLLLSAGISSFDVNLQGKTPLHVAASSRSDGALLCTSLLIMHGDKALRMQDKSGNTPLHCAVLANNVAIVESLLNNGASLTITNKVGNSPRHLAKSLKYDDILDIIDEKRTGKLRKKKDSEQAAKMTKHQQERIMKVWEKFFENALMGVDFDLDDDDKQESSVHMHSDSKTSYKGYDSSAKQSDNALANVLFKEDHYQQNSLYPSETKDYNYNFSYKDPEKISYQYDHVTNSYKEVYTGELTTEPENDTDRVFRCASEWFSWILAYEHDSERRLALALTTGGDGTDGYYTANCFALDQNFDLLDEHLDRLDQYGLWQGYSAANIASNSDELYGSGGYNEETQAYAYYYPSSIKSAIAAGWINFFDIDTNSCCWMHIPSGLTETFLPLGHDLIAWDLGLEQHIADEESKEEEEFDTDCWLKPPQVVARSWVMVSIKPPENAEEEKITDDAPIEDIWYFSNRVTGHSSWDKPAGWDQLLLDADGWVLCAEESAPDNLYWYVL